MAATANVLDGGLLLMYVGGVAVGRATSHDLSFSLGVRDITNKDSANTVQNLPANTSWEASGEALYAFDTTGYDYSDMFSILKNRTSVTLIMGRTTPKNAGDKYYTGTAYLTSLTLNTPNEGENASYSFTFTGTGALTEATIT